MQSIVYDIRLFFGDAAELMKLSATFEGGRDGAELLLDMHECLARVLIFDYQELVLCLTELRAVILDGGLNVDADNSFLLVTRIGADDMGCFNFEFDKEVLKLLVDMGLSLAFSASD
ncbi:MULTISPECIES: hypothetical protein [Chromobacterium]|nr:MULTISPECIES: hypothetical protein [Chromobacterium]BBH12822.1 hypothetical protein CH06BL_20700 [Chromobacterium haemolyticum]